MSRAGHFFDSACDAAYEANAATDDLAGVEAAVSRVLHRKNGASLFGSPPTW